MSLENLISFFSENSIAILISAVIGFISVTISALVSLRILKKQQKHAFFEKQLKEFYNPLWALRLKIQTMSELRARILSTTNSVWVKEAERMKPGKGPDFEPFQKTIDFYNNHEEELRNLYKKMEKTFLDNIWLAETETQEFIEKLIHYNHAQDLALSRNIPRGVYPLIEVKEEELKTFYDHLLTTVKKLQNEIRK